MVVVDLISGGLQLLRGVGDGDFDDPVSLSTTGIPTDVLLTDVDSDDDLDIVANLPVMNGLSILINSGDGSFVEGEFEGEMISLTLNKIYDVVEQDDEYYRIVDDTDEDYLYPKSMFEAEKLQDGPTYAKSSFQSFPKRVPK